MRRRTSRHAVLRRIQKLESRTEHGPLRRARGVVAIYSGAGYVDLSFAPAGPVRVGSDVRDAAELRAPGEFSAVAWLPSNGR